MQRGNVAIIALAAALLAGCTPSQKVGAPVMLANGTEQYNGPRLAGTVTCSKAPVEISGNGNNLTLVGSCRRLTVAGDHNDIDVSMAPGGTIEITGQHNDVWYRPAISGPEPTLKDSGLSNTFHRE